MAISITSLIQSSQYTNSLTSTLKAAGLSSDKVDLVEGQLQDIVETATQQNSGTTDASAIRSALDTKLAEDVKSGKLSQDDADTITKALDTMDKGSATGGQDTAGAQCAGGGPPAGGGGGGSGEKTEVSRTETISGSIKTTTITYDDGSTEEETSAASDAEIAAAAGSAEETGDAPKAAVVDHYNGDSNSSVDTEQDPDDAQKRAIIDSLSRDGDKTGSSVPGPDGKALKPGEAPPSAAQPSEAEASRAKNPDAGSGQDQAERQKDDAQNSLAGFFAGFQPGAMFERYA